MKPIRAIIFDLDGVIVSSDHFHYLGWKALADELEMAFDEERNHALRGVSRMESLEILLGGRTADFSDSEKLALAERKNGIYRGLLDALGPQHLLPGVADFLAACRKKELMLAIGSSSKNGRFILEKIGLARAFDSVVDGSDITRSKPDPEVFLKAAAEMGCPASACLVVEDAEAGVAAAVAAGMDCLAVGAAAGDPRAAYSATDLSTAQLPFLPL
ncbi:MAG: beta-phosphoglucomutase [Opitutales bacterium]